MSISARAAETIKPPKPKRIKVQCPVCEHEFSPFEPGKPRSTPQHRRFFALCKAAFENWPESHDMQFTDATDCRKWLTMKAGWRHMASQSPIIGLKPELAVQIATLAMRAAGAHAVAQFHKGDLIIWVPKSIKFNIMPHQEFCALSDAVSQVIEAETGIMCDSILPPKQQV
jgi:hypothetical protein